MAKLLSISFLLSIAVLNSFSQSYDLCGIWLAYNYECPSDTFNTEVIEIQHNGDEVIATKIIGDDCVTTGHITWQGTYDKDTFDVVMTIGIPSNPNGGTIPSTMIVIDSNRIQNGAFVYFIRASCEQIDSMQLDLDTLTIDCIDCDTTDTTISPIPNIFIPNVFSPNGDLNNDMLYVRGNNIKELTFIIYNRWGEKVFESKDINDGWDGTHKGETLNPAVFVYYVEGTFIDGEPFSKKGNVTLVK